MGRVIRIGNLNTASNRRADRIGIVIHIALIVKEKPVVGIGQLALDHQFAQNIIQGIGSVPNINIIETASHLQSGSQEGGCAVYPEGIVLFAKINFQFFGSVAKIDRTGDPQACNITVDELAAVGFVVAAIVDNDKVFARITIDIGRSGDEIHPPQGGRIQAKGGCLHSNGIITITSVNK